VYGAKRKLADVVKRRNLFSDKMIDAERQKLKQLERKKGEVDASDSADEKMGMIGVMLSLQKTEPDVYTDTFINALVPVSSTTTHVSTSLFCFCAANYHAFFH